MHAYDQVNRRSTGKQVKHIEFSTSSPTVKDHSSVRCSETDQVNFPALTNVALTLIYYVLGVETGVVVHQ